MKLPKTKEEIKAYKQSCIDTCEQEITEMQHHYGIQIDWLYYSSHLGTWCLKIESEEEQEFETKEEVIYYLHQTYIAS